MKDKVIIIEAGEAGKTAQILAEKMNVTVVTAEQAQAVFNNMPTFPIVNSRILDLNDSVIATKTFQSGGLSKRAARRKAERDARKKKRRM